MTRIFTARRRIAALQDETARLRDEVAQLNHALKVKHAQLLAAQRRVNDFEASRTAAPERQ